MATRTKVRRWKFISGIEAHWKRRLLMVLLILPLAIRNWLYEGVMIGGWALMWLALFLTAKPIYFIFVASKSARECWNNPRSGEWSHYGPLVMTRDDAHAILDEMERVIELGWIVNLDEDHWGALAAIADGRTKVSEAGKQ